MSLESVLQAIQAKGREEADAVLAAGGTERERILAEAGTSMAKIIADAEAQARVQAERRRTQELARAELESRRTALAAQKEELDEVYRRTLARLGELEGAADIVRYLLRKNEAIWKDGGRVYATSKDAATVKAAVGPAYAGPMDGIGGFVLESRDGTVRMDLRYEALLRDVWNNAIKEVAEVLWPSRAPRA